MSALLTLARWPRPTPRSTARLHKTLDALFGLLGQWCHEPAPCDSALYDLYLPGGVAAPTDALATVTLAWPLGDWVELPEPQRWVQANRAHSAIAGATLAINHRALNGATIYIDERGDAAIENAHHAGFHHSLYDIVSVAADILIDLAELPLDASRIICELALALAAPRAFEHSLRATRRLLLHPEPYKAFAVVAGLRDTARAARRYDDEREYVWALLLELVRRMGELAPDAPGYGRAQIVGAVLCARLEAWDTPDWPPRASGSGSLMWVEPTTYRHALVDQLFRSVRLAESRVVVGLRGLTRLPLFQHIQQPEVARPYLHDKADATLLVPVDMDRLRDQNERSLYELLLTSLVGAARHRPAARPVLDELNALKRETITTDNTLLAQRNLEHAVDLICQDVELSLCFVLDTFDQAYVQMPVRALHNLCVLRDQHPEQVCFIMGLRELPERLRPLDGDAEFDALFWQPPLWLLPDTAEDALWLIDDLAARSDWQPSIVARRQMIELSGHHAGLIRALFSALHHADGERPAEDITWALAQRAVQVACAKIWEGLANYERRALLDWLDGAADAATSTTFRELSRKGIVDLSGPVPQLFSRLLERYLTDFMVLLRIDGSGVWLGSKKLRTNGVQLKLLTHMYNHPGRVFSTRELLDAVYEGHDANGRDPSNIHVIVRRVREDIEPRKDHHRYLVTRDDGYQLIGTDLDPALPPQ